MKPNGQSGTLIGTVRTFSERFVKRAFKRMGYEVRKVGKDFPEVWSGNSEFKLLFSEIRSRTIVDEGRCFMLYQLARTTNSRNGHAAEVGVYMGGTGKLLAKACPSKTVYLFDTFSGEPAEDPEVDSHKKGDFADTSLESVRQLCRDCGNVKISPGLFPRDTGGIVKDELFSFVHVDVSLYRSIMDVLSFFYDKMAPGGIMLVEGYEWWRCPGAKRAITEFLVGKPEIPVVTARFQCMFSKQGDGVRSRIEGGISEV